MSQAFNSDGAWRGRPTDVTSFSQGPVGSRMLVGFGRYPVEGENQNDCSLVKKLSNLRFKGTDWSMCTRPRISTSGEGGSIRWLRPALLIGSYIPREWKAVLSSRQMEVRLRLNLPVAALMKSGCAGVTGLALSSSPDSTLRLELHVGRPTDNRLLSTLALPGMQTFSSSILREARLAG